ncbi:PepSY domain-containing protein [Companilactobacillus sp. DQM5]|uniref:PepSY domain-containing protein n=1 Tax=Companilactobacillus sp. DQM5 TaxID=3463359 RepID=UPI004059A5E8
MSRVTRSWIIVGIILIGMVSTFWFFSIASEPYTSARQQANNIAFKSADINTPDYFSNFTQKKQYFTVGGLTSKNKYRYVIIDAKSGKIKILNKNQYSKDYIMNMIKEKFNVKKIFHINLGLIDKKPIWEISYLDKNNKSNYVFIDYYSGKITETIKDI